MSQGRLILNVNSNYERGNSDGYTETPTNAVGSFLDRRDPRINPKRQVFRPKQKSSGYIFNGRYSRRWTVAAGGDIVTVVDAVPVQPGMRVAFDMVYRCNASPANLSMQISVARPSVYSAVLPDENKLYVPGDGFNYEWALGSFPVTLSDPTQDPLEYWERIGASVKIPTNSFGLTCSVTYTGPASESVFDVGELSIQALDSVIHAKG